MMKPIASLLSDLEAGITTSEALTEHCLAKIEDPAGEGAKAFIAVYRDQALATARALDTQRKAGLPMGPLGGIPISIKDLLDEKGVVTTAGSVVRKDANPAQEDAPIVKRLRASGAVILGRTNMTEFAYSGVGWNPHYGTPKNPYDREIGRIPGGSSSGAAISVTDGMAAMGIGSDTGGSIRLPSALCGLTGFKPTQRRVPTTGAFPLSSSLDSLGPLALSVDCADRVDQILSGVERTLDTLPVSGLRFGVPKANVMEGLDPEVAQAFDAALRRLSEAGAQIIEFSFKTLDTLPQRLGYKGGFAASECFHVVQDLLDTRGEQFDQRVRNRIEVGRSMLAHEYIQALHDRAALIRQADMETARFDAVALPGNPIIAPTIAEIDQDDARFSERNLLLLRNTIVGNWLDRCGITIPCTAPGEAPVGFMLMGETLGDDHLLSIAKAIEPVVRLDG